MTRSRRPFGSIRRLRSGRWQARYFNLSTGQRTAAPTTFDTKAAAHHWLSTVEADQSRGELLDPRLAQLSFADWADEWRAGLHVKPKTPAGYESSLRNHVLPVFGSRPVVTITYRDCKGFVTDLLADGFAPGTVGEARKVLRLVLGEALRADAIRRNPAVGLRVPRGERQEMIFLEPDQVFALAHEVARSSRRPPMPQYGLLVRLAAFTGLRAGEVCACGLRG